VKPASALGVIGDVHGELAALEAALAWLERAGVDQLLCVGDIVDGHVDVDACCKLLAARGVLSVRGNHDRWLLDDRLRDLPDATPRNALTPPSLRFLMALPRSRSLETVAGPLLLCHGLGDDDMCGLTDDDQGYTLETNAALSELLRHGSYRYVVAGHTHRRMARRIGSITFVNAGTLHRDFNPCFARLDLAKQRVRFVDVDAQGNTKGADERPLP
jgi:putative phosphoesterase